MQWLHGARADGAAITNGSADCHELKAPALNVKKNREQRSSGVLRGLAFAEGFLLSSVVCRPLPVD
jgi:hypothetical protein